jgi:hypothetical protein
MPPFKHERTADRTPLSPLGRRRARTMARSRRPGAPRRTVLAWCLRPAPQPTTSAVANSRRTASRTTESGCRESPYMRPWTSRRGDPGPHLRGGLPRRPGPQQGQQRQGVPRTARRDQEHHRLAYARGGVVREGQQGRRRDRHGAPGRVEHPGFADPVRDVAEQPQQLLPVAGSGQGEPGQVRYGGGGRRVHVPVPAQQGVQLTHGPPGVRPRPATPSPPAARVCPAPVRPRA